METSADTRVGNAGEGESRDISDYTNYVSGYHKRPVSPRSVSRTPSSKYRDRTLTKATTNVSLPHPDVEEEADPEPTPTPPNVSKSRTKSQPDEVEGGEGLKPDIGRLDTQRSISSQICVSPSWSRAATKKKAKKELKKQQEREQKELEKKLKIEASKIDVANKREPRRLTKKPPSSSRASSTHSWMPRPSTTSSIKSFWSNRSSRASSIQEPETDGEVPRPRNRKRGSWFPKMWPKRESSKSRDPGSGDQPLETDQHNPDMPNRSLHTVKKRSNLRAAANPIDPKDDEPRRSPSRRYSIHPVGTDGEQQPLSLNGIIHQSQSPATFPVLSPTTTRDSQKSLGTTALSNRRLKPTPIQSGDAKLSVSNSRVPVSNSRVSSRQNEPEDKPRRASWRESFDDPGKLAQATLKSLGSPAANSSLSSKQKETENDKGIRSQQPARKSVTLLDNPPEQPNTDIVSPRKMAEKRPERPKQKDAATSVLEKLNNDKRQSDPNRPLAVPSNPKIATISNVRSISADSNKPNQGAKRMPNSNSNNNLDASFRPSPLSGPPAVPDSESSAKTKIQDDETGIALEGRLQSARLVQVASARSVETGNNRELHDRMPKQKRTSGNTDLQTQNQQGAPVNGERQLIESTRPTIPSLDDKPTEEKPQDMASLKDKPTNSSSRPPASMENKPPPRPRRNSFDFVHRLRPNPGKIETKLRKKRAPSTAGSVTDNTTQPPAPTVTVTAAATKITPTTAALPSPVISSSNIPQNKVDSQPRPLRPAGPSPLRLLASDASATDDDVLSQPVKKPWLENGKGKERITSSSTLSSLSSIGTAAAGPSRRVAANTHQRIAKMFVICCQCRFWHDMPSEAYAKLAFPSSSDSPDNTDGKNVNSNDNSNAKSNRKDVGRRGPDIIVESPSLSEEKHNSHRRPPLSIPSVIKCCWCEHRFTKSCCAGWTAHVQLHERHH